jgi:hypothetical protein
MRSLLLELAYRQKVVADSDTAFAKDANGQSQKARS